MQLVLSSIAAGGLVGASNQYLCLLIVSIAAKLDLISLTPQMTFMESWWFLSIVAAFWLLTIAPAYASMLGPGVMNVINTIVNFVSGLAVPISAGLLSLAAVGIITGINPDLQNILKTLQLFNEEGGIGITGFLVAGGSALTATVLTGSKFLAKPAVSSATGVTGTISAPAYATLENAASVVLMPLMYLLTLINPWLLVGLLVLITLLILGLLAFALYQLWKLGKGIRRVIHLIKTRPKTGLSVVAEFLVWGSGWLIWKQWKRGIPRLIIWVLWVLILAVVIPAITAALDVALVAIPPLAALATIFGVVLAMLTIAVGLIIGLKSACLLMKAYEHAEAAPAPASMQPSTT